MDWIRNEIAENLKAREMLKKKYVDRGSCREQSLTRVGTCSMGNVSFVERIKSWCQLKYWCGFAFRS